MIWILFPNPPTTKCGVVYIYCQTYLYVYHTSFQHLSSFLVIICLVFGFDLFISFRFWVSGYCLPLYPSKPVLNRCVYDNVTALLEKGLEEGYKQYGSYISKFYGDIIDARSVTTILTFRHKHSNHHVLIQYLLP